MPGGGLIVNGIDVAERGARVAPSGTGHVRGADLADQVLAAGDGRVGDILLAEEPTVQEVPHRQLLEVEAPTPGALLAALDDLKWLFLGGALRVQFGDAPYRLRFARCLVFEPLYPTGPAQGAVDCQVALTLMLRPFAVRCRADGVPDVTRLGLATGVRTPLPVGTAWSYPTVTLSGGASACTDPILLVRDHGGTPVYRMPFVTTIDVNERLVIASEFCRITRVHGTTGAESLAYGAWDRSNDPLINDFPVLRPADAHPPSGAWATAEVVAGPSGTPVGEIAYVEAYS